MGGTLGITNGYKKYIKVLVVKPKGTEHSEHTRRWATILKWILIKLGVDWAHVIQDMDK